MWSQVTRFTLLETIAGVDLNVLRCMYVACPGIQDRHAVTPRPTSLISAEDQTRAQRAQRGGGLHGRKVEEALIAGALNK